MDHGVPQDDTAFQQANAYYRAGDLGAAEKAYLTIQPENLYYMEAQVNLALLHKQQGKVTLALQRLKTLQEQPQAPIVVWLNLGQIQLQEHQLLDAEHTFEQAIARESARAEGWYGLGCVHRTQHKLSQAKHHFEQALKLKPGWSDAALDLANIERQLGQPKPAQHLLEGVLAKDGSNWRAHYALARLHDDLQQSELFRLHFQRAMELAPDPVALLHLMGVTRLSSGRVTDALPLLKDALKADPKRHHVALSLATALLKAQRSSEAKALLVQLQKSQDTPLLQQLAQLQQQAGDLDGALSTLMRIPPPLSPARHITLAHLYLLRFEPDLAQPHIDAIEKTHPNQWHGLQAKRAQCLGDIPTALSYLQAAQDLPPHTTTDAVTLAYTALFSDQLSHQELFALQSQATVQLAVNHPILEMPHTLEEHALNAPLRIGYLLPDALSNPDIHEQLPVLLNHHDTTRVQCTIYHTGLLVDGLMLKAKPLAHQWRDMHHWAEESIAEHIRKDQIQILVDLSGYGPDHHLGVFAFKAAPLQISYLGLPCYHPLPGMNGVVLDPVMLPEHPSSSTYTSHHLEQGLYLFQPEGAPPLDLHRLCSVQQVIFGSLSTPDRLTDTTLHVWSQLLNSTPQARLVIIHNAYQSETICQAVRHRLNQQQIPLDRVTLMPPSTQEDVWTSYTHMDILLDTLTYQEDLPTCRALWMGVPVLTLSGHAPKQRVGASILTSAGFSEGIAQSEAQYLTIARQWAEDRPALLTLKQDLRRRLQRSDLCHAKNHTAALEALYTEMVTQKLLKNSPPAQETTPKPEKPTANRWRWVALLCVIVGAGALWTLISPSAQQPAAPVTHAPSLAAQAVSPAPMAPVKGVKTTLPPSPPERVAPVAGSKAAVTQTPEPPGAIARSSQAEAPPSTTPDPAQTRMSKVTAAQEPSPSQAVVEREKTLAPAEERPSTTPDPAQTRINKVTAAQEPSPSQAVVEREKAIAPKALFTRMDAQTGQRKVIILGQGVETLNTQAEQEHKTQENKEVASLNTSVGLESPSLKATREHTPHQTVTLHAPQAESQTTQPIEPAKGAVRPILTSAPSASQGRPSPPKRAAPALPKAAEQSAENTLPPPPPMQTPLPVSTLDMAPTKNDQKDRQDTPLSKGDQATQQEQHQRHNPLPSQTNIERNKALTESKSQLPAAKRAEAAVATPDQHSKALQNPPAGIATGGQTVPPSRVTPDQPPQAQPGTAQVNRTDNPTAPHTPAHSEPKQSSTPAALSEPQQSSTPATFDLEGLLKLGFEDLKKRRLMIPVGDNAYEKFKRILAMDPMEKRAIEGMLRIADRYHYLCTLYKEQGLLGRSALACGKAQQIRSQFGGATPLPPKEHALHLLLEIAHDHLRRDRLMWPKEESAYGFFLKALQRDPGNQVALLGLQGIAIRYIELCERDMKVKSYNKARVYCAKAQQIWDQHQQGDIAYLHKMQQQLKPHFQPALTP
ncbi:O-linked N-acetylglucosamine transferase, SPINDLY family protein [Magnetococcus sp. PR-3]|uniref:O-linked N-acetylglucosamine transferase, SPINDLY family protein n=1 Tax=Magnetococcus sp. PR-3 TaxID=3120355 RepID=UPI002FCDF620